MSRWPTTWRVVASLGKVTDAKIACLSLAASSEERRKVLWDTF